MVDLAFAVEFWIDGAWVDFTRVSDRLYCLGVGGSDSVSVSRGQSPESSRPTPTQLNFTFRDEDSYLDNENPESPYYGKLGRKTLVRLSIEGDVQCVLRVKEFVPTWEPTADPTGGRNLQVKMTATGPLGEFEQGSKPLRSPAYRAITSAVNDPWRVQYWPIEEESGATTITSPYPDGGAVSYAGTIDFGSYTDSLASARLARFGSADALIFFNIPPWTNSLGQHQFAATLRFPETPLANGAVIYRIYFTGGTVDFVDLVYSTGDVLELKAYAGGVLIDTMAGTDWTGIIDNREVVFLIKTEQSGADVLFSMFSTNVDDSWLIGVGDTLSGRTLGRAFAWTIGQSDCTGLGLGHVFVSKNKDAFGNYFDDLDSSSSVVVTGARGYLGETAGARIARLAAEEDLSISVV